MSYRQTDWSKYPSLKLPHEGYVSNEEIIRRQRNAFAHNQKRNYVREESSKKLGTQTCERILLLLKE